MLTAHARALSTKSILEYSGRQGTHLCTHCHWCCLCPRFPGRQVSSNLDKGGRHLDVTRTANCQSETMSWSFSASMETSCRRMATTPVQWNLQNSSNVALLLYVWSTSSWKYTRKRCATTVAPDTHREESVLTTQYDMLWLQKWQHLS